MAEAEDVSELVRPYAITGGRTRPRYELAVEALVHVDGSSRREPFGLQPESLAIIELCRTWRSVAEVSALCRLPLGVARVLISDLAYEGLVRVQTPQGTLGGRPDLAMLERVLDGLRQL